MKKNLVYVLIACTIVGMQTFKCPEVNASPITKATTTSIMAVKNSESAIPKLVKAEQISPNQIQISYDIDVDITLGTKSTNYWVQDLENSKPKFIATLGKNDKVNVKNSLTDSLVKITPKDNSAKTFILTFNQNIPSGKKYKLIICYVTVKGAPPYSGDNGMATFTGK